MKEYVAETRVFLKEYTDERVEYYCGNGYIPTIEEIVTDIYEDLTPMSYDEAQLYNRKGVEVLSVDELAQNIQNLVSFNLDEIDESIKKPRKLRIKESGDLYYTNLLDGIYDTLKREFRNDERFVEIKKVSGPNGSRPAVRVETEHLLSDGNTLFTDVFYILDKDGIITMYDNDSKVRKFMDLEALRDFFYDFLDQTNYVTEAFSSEDDLEDLIQSFEQEYDSSVTSINSAKLPTIFGLVKKLGGFKKGTLNADYGGGRFDNAAEYLKDLDVLNLVYDPFNRSKEHNKDVIDFIKKNGGADTVTCSNVLNVIKEPENRLAVIKNCDRLVKDGGTVYFTVYEGSGSGEGKANDKRKSYQTNMKTEQYQEELEKVFSNVTRKGKLFICK